jgi:hypothetical protein
MLKRNTLGVSIAAMLGTIERAYTPAGICSLDDLPTIQYAGGGSVPGIGLWIRNQSVAAQVVDAATVTLITGSVLTLPQGAKLTVGTRLRWRLTMTKTAAGVATSLFSIAFGTAATVAGLTNRVDFTKPAGTGVVDEATVTIEATVRSVGAAGVVVGNFNLVHNLAATGHAQIPVVDVTTVSSGFDNDSDEGLVIGLELTTGAADAITIEQCTAELIGAN